MELWYLLGHHVQSTQGVLRLPGMYRVASDSEQNKFGSFHHKIIIIIINNFVSLFFGPNVVGSF